MQTPVTPPVAGGFEALLSAIKPIIPLPALLILLPALWWFFRDTWKELDDDATRWRVRLSEEGRTDFRPFVALAMCAVILTLQEYYGGRKMCIRDSRSTHADAMQKPSVYGVFGYFPCFAAHESRSPIVRLRTGAPGFESESTQK